MIPFGKKIEIDEKMSIIFPRPESMILLGSIERCELQAALDWWLSAERRVYIQGEGVSSLGSQVNWESFAFVDEEVGEENEDKVRGAPKVCSHTVVPRKTPKRTSLFSVCFCSEVDFKFSDLTSISRALCQINVFSENQKLECTNLTL